MAAQTQCSYRCRPRFKGIETFFRRIAFNLGNSPSQTEVKIISCIPIDVTDLQHRIVSLERELEHYQQQPPDMPTAVVGTALGGPGPHRGEPPGPLPEPLTNSTSSSQEKSTLSLPYHATENQEITPQSTSGLRSSEVPVIDNYVCEPRNDETLSPKKMRVSKKKKTSKHRTELVYFAQQAVNTPFTPYDQVQSTRKDNPIENMLSQGYLADIARKQGRSQRIPSNESQFSSPICRDSPCHQPAAACDSDVCSCCPGHFNDVDASRRTFNRYGMPSAPNDHLSMYYDSSMYDLVPVKEMKDDIDPKKENLQTQLKCNRGKVFRSRVQPYTVTYNSNGAVRNGCRLVGKRKPPIKSPNRAAPKRRCEQQFAIDKGFPTKRPKQLYQDIELQTYYMRPMRKAKNPSPPRPLPVKQKNAECLTICVNNTECQTASTKSVQLDAPPPAQENNEATLNQIKTILQTVLTEVKTNVREKNQETKKFHESIKIEPKRDAVVQKGVSQKNMAACSTLLNSFYYSPYSMNPYSASCSPQYYPNNYYPPAMKCFQNYPLFIQTTGRQCDKCYKKTPGTGKEAHRKTAAHTATNTESVIKNQHSKETEKLIKEIYKSIAVNFDVTSKEATTSECDDIKSEPFQHNYRRKLANESKRRESMSVKTAPMRDMPKPKVPATPLYMNPTFNAARTSDEVSVHSTHAVTARHEGIQRTVDLLTQPQSSATDEGDQKIRWYKEKANVRAQAYYDKTSSVDVDATASEVTVIPAKKKERSSLFTKVCNVFKGRTNQTKKNVEITHSRTESEGDGIEEYEASDSDDYQTIYSERDDTRGRRTVTAAPVQLQAVREHRYRRLSHSKVAYPRYVPQTRAPERHRRPNTEQEYRRQWNEGISFRAFSRAERHASEKAHRRRSDSERLPPYWRDYEARYAYIEPDVEPSGETRQTEDQDVYEMQEMHRRRNQVTFEEEDEPKVLKSVAKKLQWFKKRNLPECSHKLKKLLVDT